MTCSQFRDPTSGEMTSPEPQDSLITCQEMTVNHRISSIAISVTLGIWCLLVVFGPNAKAQSYSIDWHKVSSGGGTSAGGVFSVSGTIGQCDSGGSLTGGTYSLTGGFWSLLSLAQTPGAPTLKIFLTSTNTVVVSWPWPSTGWSFQHNNTLSLSNWGAPSEIINHDALNGFIIVNPSGGSHFYRLTKP